MPCRPRLEDVFGPACNASAVSAPKRKLSPPRRNARIPAKGIRKESSGPRARKARRPVQLCKLKKASRDTCRQHATFNGQCAECIYVRRRPLWETGVGSHLQNRDGVPGRLVWLQARPEHWHSGFALGCLLCHHLAQNYKDANTSQSRRHLTSKWARFEIRGFKSMQSSNLRLHRSSALHKLALHAWLSPGTAHWKASALVLLSSHALANVS